MTVVDRRWGSRPCSTGQTRYWGHGLDQRREPPLPEDDDGGGGEGLMGQSRGNVAIDRASGGAGAGARAWSPSMQPLAPEVPLRTSGPLRPLK